MLAKLRVSSILLLVVISTVLHTSVLFTVALLKFLLPMTAVRRALSRVLTLIAESWVSVNSRMIQHFTPTKFTVQGGDTLRYAGWYLVISNHQSWVDILVLQKIFNRRIPFLKFFLKQQLIWVPLLGLAWWALDFPFMKRYTPQQLQRRPELKGADIRETRKACARFKHIPVSVMNFVEGTRFTPKKHARHPEAYRHLLRPKAGGIAFVMNAMGEILQSVVDVSIVYPAGIPTLFDLLGGRVPEIRVRIRERLIPQDLVSGDYENDAAFRERFQLWVNGLWAEKDAEVADMRG
jgi:1-acyl-sn-glycerol-3-phosphate acyltransferase